MKGEQQWHASALRGRRNPEWQMILELLERVLVSERVSVSERGNLLVIGLWTGRTLMGRELWTGSDFGDGDGAANEADADCGVLVGGGGS